MDELRTALELATDEELQELTWVMFQRKFNPLDYVSAPTPISVQSCDRLTQIDALEERFRFLAADGFTVLRGETHQVSYREVLMGICNHLRLPYSNQWHTTELESEIFLHVLNRAWEKLPRDRQTALTRGVQQSLMQNRLWDRLPEALQNDPVRLTLTGGGAIALNAFVQPLVLRQIAYQFAVQFAKYEAAKTVLAQGGSVAGKLFKGHVAAQMARRGMAVSAARYGMARTVLSVLGPAMWAWFLTDLGWRAIATNYGRVIPAVFALAQIRLTRSDEEWDYDDAYGYECA
ncbi:MAG: hypothetical protein AAGA67_05020 [Cyanobacteria bacterium P01_F01_bin.153]